MATEKQVNYILVLLDKAGYPTRHMVSSFKDLGAKMTERSGSVRDWVASRNRQEASALIDQLKTKIGA